MTADLITRRDAVLETATRLNTRLDEIREAYDEQIATLVAERDVELNDVSKEIFRLDGQFRLLNELISNDEAADAAPPAPTPISARPSRRRKS